MELKKPTEAQVKAIDGLIDGSLTPDTVHNATYRVLIEREWVRDGVVTQAGLDWTTYPTIEVDVAVFGKQVTYTHQQYADNATKTQVMTGKAPLEKSTVVFPAGTELLITWVHGNKLRQALEGMINVNGKAMWVRIYKAPHMKLQKRLMPDKRAIENGVKKTKNDS